MKKNTLLIGICLTIVLGNCTVCFGNEEDFPRVYIHKNESQPQLVIESLKAL